MTGGKKRHQFCTMSQKKHKKIESERLKNVGYHQKVYWKPRLSYTLTYCTSHRTFIFLTEHIRSTYLKTNDIIKVEMAQGKMEQNVKLFHLKWMSSSVCKGKDPKGTDRYEGGKGNTEWLRMSFIPNNLLISWYFMPYREVISMLPVL